MNGPALVAFLKKYIAKPRSLAKLEDLSFYRFIESHEEALHEAGIQVDTAKAVAELDAKFVKPSEGIAKLLKRFPTLTAMYTTMSPAEMTQDPTFVFSRWLGKVAAVHHAKGVRRCKTGVPYWQAPIEITLASGRKFIAPEFPNRYGDDSSALIADMPDAEVIEQLHAEGPASSIQDNTALIEATLAEARNTPEPGTSHGLAAGGGVAAGLLLLGGWGWRRRRTRR